MSSRMLLLTRKSVDDNATVRVVTVCTLIYLPASFTASFFGMNFFNQSNSSQFEISPRFWVYVAITVPLTVVTIGAWYLYKLQYDRKKNSDEEAIEYLPK